MSTQPQIESLRIKSAISHCPLQKAREHSVISKTVAASGSESAAVKLRELRWDTGTGAWNRAPHAQPHFLAAGSRFPATDFQALERTGLRRPKSEPPASNHPARQFCQTNRSHPDSWQPTSSFFAQSQNRRHHRHRPPPKNIENSLRHVSLPNEPRSHLFSMKKSPAAANFQKREPQLKSIPHEDCRKPTTAPPSLNMNNIRHDETSQQSGHPGDKNRQFCRTNRIHATNCNTIFSKRTQEIIENKRDNDEEERPPPNSLYDFAKRTGSTRSLPRRHCPRLSFFAKRTGVTPTRKNEPGERTMPHSEPLT